MVQSDEMNVKEKLGRWARCCAWCLERKARALEFMDGHPRVGWFIAFLSIVNVVLNLLQLSH